MNADDSFELLLVSSSFLCSSLLCRKFYSGISVMNRKLCRFGIDSVCGPDEMAKAEELKRKARAERFFYLLYGIALEKIV